MISTEFHTGNKAWDLERDDLLSQIVASKEKVKELEERYKKEISEKDEYCGAVVSDKNNLEATVFKLNEEIHAISAEFHTGNKAWDLEKNDLLSQIVASKEKQIILEKKVTELETNLDSARKDLDYSRASTIEKERNIVELQYKLAETAATNKFLEEKNSSLLSDANKRNTVLEEKNATLQQKVREQEMSLQSLNTNLESLRELKSRRKLFQPKSPALENGKENSSKRRENGKCYGLCEKSKLSVVIENRTSNTSEGNATNPVAVKRTPQNPVAVKRTPLQTVPVKTKPIWH